MPRIIALWPLAALALLATVGVRAVLQPPLDGRAGASLRSSVENTAASPRFKEGEVLVKFKSVAAATAAAASAAEAGVLSGGASATQSRVIVGPGAPGYRPRPAQTINGGATVPPEEGPLVLIPLPEGASVEEAVKTYSASPGVESAEPNFAYKLARVPNDEYAQDQSLWGMRGQYGSNAEKAWDIKTDCSNVAVAVIDTGIQINHPDLKDSIWRNNDEIAGNGQDDDRNGFVDDVNGWNFVAFGGNPGSPNVYDGPYEDYHGTHVAGTIAAQGNNGIGVPGVCWSNLRIIPIKIFGRRDPADPNSYDVAYTSDIVRAFYYIVNLKLQNKINVVASCNSWGGGEYSYSLQEAIVYAGQWDILTVAAAGNEGAPLAIYPANYQAPSVISVGSLDVDGRLSSYSNYGPNVHLAAPGNNIGSTWPTDYPGVDPPGYVFISGTSMAAPHVTGAIALYKAYYPTATAQQIKAALLASAAPTTSLRGVVRTSGRLDIWAMLERAPASCYASCPSGQYCVRSTFWEDACARCPAQCAACTTDNGSCTKCADGREGLPLCHGFTCFPACAANQWCDKKPLSALCTACSPKCATCTSTSTCTKCADGREGLPQCNGFTCFPACTAGKYCLKRADGASCTACPTNCATCTSATACQSCKSGYKSVPPAATCATKCNVAGATVSSCGSCCSGACRTGTRVCK